MLSYIWLYDITHKVSQPNDFRIVMDDEFFSQIIFTEYV